MKSLMRAVGVIDITRAERVLNYPEFAEANSELILDSLRDVGDPDAALWGLMRVLEYATELRSWFTGDELSVASKRLVYLLGLSHGFTDWLVRDPYFISEELAKIPAEFFDLKPLQYLENIEALAKQYPDAAETVLLRRAYRRTIMALALLDTKSKMSDSLAKVSAHLADLAGFVLQKALDIAQQKFDCEVPLAVIALGKCGARELNYLSDVDVMYILADDQDDEVYQQATKVAQEVGKIVFGPGIEPPLFEVDTALRPEGKDGPLVRTLASCKEYYTQWAHLWEFQAMLKARFIAGAEKVGNDFTDFIADLVWSASEREGFLESIRKMRARVESHIPKSESDRELKLGIGGLRDIEFSVQLLQLVHGRTDESLRVRDTLSALEVLTTQGYIGREDSSEFITAYKFLRVLEHGTQLIKMQRTHLLPKEENKLRHLARLVRHEFHEKNNVALENELIKTWEQVKLKVRTIYQKLFFKPILTALVKLSHSDLSLSHAAVDERLRVLGYENPKQAVAHIKALTQGVNRAAKIQQHLLPVFLQWFSEGVNPDNALLNFRRLSEALGESHWYLRMLRDSPVAAERMARIVTLSNYTTSMLEFLPEGVAWLDDDKALQPRAAKDIETEMHNIVKRNKTTETAVRLVRGTFQRELLRLSMMDTLATITPIASMKALSELYFVFIRAMYSITVREVGNPKAQFGILAMGRLSGRELVYGSDADVMFVYEPFPEYEEYEASQYALDIVNTLKRFLKLSVEPPLPGEKLLELDARLRPEGKDGAMVRSLESYANYYEKWAKEWEYQALLRCAPLAGDEALLEKFITLIDEYRYPVKPTRKAITELRRIKARVEAERLPRNADPNRHTKLGRGSLSDIEWLAQLIQFKFAGKDEGYRIQDTLAVFNHAVDVKLLPERDAQKLADSWLICSKVRSRIRLWSEKNSDVLPDYSSSLEAIARLCGWPSDSVLEFEDYYLKTTRIGRFYYEKWFYDI
ncbi:MAG: bifunctional [glutamine synthetase] adenylyltransferase/[glutamine synthetase]-adenylyl-L-tyrosine phosphorylase [Micrococcaceae bacterium]